MDRAWWITHAGNVAGDFELWTSSDHVARTFGLNWVRAEPGGGVSTTPGTIRHGGNSGFQAVSLALHFGAARVVLLGYDMQFTDGRTHWHGDHRGTAKNPMGNPIAKRMKDWIGRFEQLAAEAAVPIVNATRQTALACFPRATIEEALCGPG